MDHAFATKLLPVFGSSSSYRPGQTGFGQRDPWCKLYGSIIVSITSDCFNARHIPVPNMIANPFLDKDDLEIASGRTSRASHVGII